MGRTAGGRDQWTFVRRVLAFFVDFTLVCLPLVLVVWYPTSVGTVVAEDDPRCAAGSTTCWSSGDTTYLLDEGQTILFWALLAVVVVVVLVDFVVVQGVAGGTVGKLLTGVRTVDLRHQPAGVLRCGLRLLVTPLDLLCAGWLGLVVILVSPEDRRIADYVVGTKVVHRSEVGRGFEGSSWPPPPRYPTPPAPYGFGTPTHGGSAGHPAWSPPQIPPRRPSTR